MNKLSYLSQISLLGELPMEDLMEIDRMIPMTSLSKNTVVQTPESFREGLFFIKEGKLRLYKINAGGRQFTVGLLGKGNVFGEVDSFSLGTKNIFIETMEDTLLCSMSKDQFEQFLAHRPQLAMKMLEILGDRVKEMDAMLEQLALGNIRDRVLHLLYKLSRRFGIDEGDYRRIDVRLSHQEIANMVGATRESVTVVLNELAEEGVIKKGRLFILVHGGRTDALLKTSSTFPD